MPERVSSPEERLLRLIRGQPAATTPAIAAAQDAAPAGNPKRVWPSWSWANALPVLNVCFGLIAAVCLAGMLWRFAQPVTLPPAPSAAPVTVPPPPATPAPLDTQPFQQRQLFQLPAGAGETAAPAPAANAPQAQAALASLTLMGIVDGTPPQAIIADSQTQKSYFVKEGETFGAGILVEKIESGRVLLHYQGATADLRL